jgi:CRP/FNR family transcriptional regulator, cyclic AMP receptor protein
MDEQARYGGLCAELGQVRLFNGLDDARLAQIAELCSVITRPSGKNLIEEGAEANSLYILTEGEVTISKRLALPQLGRAEGTDRILSELSASQHPLLGETALLGHAIRRTSVKLRTDCTLIRIQARELMALMKRDPQIGFHVFRQLSETLLDRLEMANTDIVKLSAALVFALED